jgi:hypothetical protein
MKAEGLWVSAWTLPCREKKLTEPSMLRNSRVLGLQRPFPAPNGLPEGVLAFRQANGSSLRYLARRLGVDLSGPEDYEKLEKGCLGGRGNFCGR